MRKSLFTVAIIMNLFFGTKSFADSRRDPTCKSPLMKVVTTLIHAEGFTRINTCGGVGSGDNCQLDFFNCKPIVASGVRQCFLRYTFGGGYPNYNDYEITVLRECEIQNIKISRL